MTEPTPAAAEPTAAAPAPAPEPSAAAPEPAKPAEDSPWADPEKAKAEIERLRRENASARTQAKQNAAEQARAELAQEIGKALGLVKEDETPDPAALAQQIGASQAEAKQARIALAVYQAAETAGGDASALLDSRTFLERVATLDPADSAGIAQAITETVAANPRLARSQPQRMAPNPAQGTSAQPPLGLNERIAEAEKSGDFKTAIRLKAAQAINPNQ